MNCGSPERKKPSNPPKPRLSSFCGFFSKEEKQPKEHYLKEKNLFRVYFPKKGLVNGL